MNTLPAAKIAILLCATLVAPQLRAETPASRFIPLQLIVGDRWDGTQTISYPVGRFTEAVPEGAASVWTGPRQWTHPKTGRSLTVYFRSREGRNLSNNADQIFAVRDDRSAIGRVADSRFGITACDQEAKYPLGLWTKGETRSFDYVCWYGSAARPQVTTITIQEIDYTYDGYEHSLRLEWILRATDVSRVNDHRVYIFAPGRGMVRQWKVP